MPTMQELLRAGGIHGADADHLHRLVGDWQLLADLSFADLLLLIPGREGGFVVAAQMRPTTGPTAYQDDLVGRVLTGRQQLQAAVDEGRVVREGDPVWVHGAPIREEAIPVRRDGRVVAVVARDTNLAAARTPSRLEIAYLRSASDLAQMVAEGRWPYPEGAGSRGGEPRVGDGLIRLDAGGRVEFASPNALSAFRRLGHLGDVEGEQLDQLTSGLAGRSHAAAEAAVVARGRSAQAAEIEAHDAVVRLRAIPLRPGGEHIGALILVRDVTELRRRELQLVGKDATIREIHHRVKNNLQTVAALLRLQARRMAVPEARAALEESVRRVSSIAVVHETLSGTLEESVQFDEVADRIIAMVAEVAAPPGVQLQRVGSFGELPAEVATPLAMVLTELVQNAVEHGFADETAGTVWVEPERGERLAVEVRDNGRGLPAGFALGDSDRLGLQIVRTLVETELRGTLTIGPAEGSAPGQSGGTAVRVELPVSVSEA